MRTIDYLEDWLILRQPTLKPRTIESYKYLISHLAPLIGSLEVESISSAAIMHALAAIAKDHSRTAEMCYVLLRSALADLDHDPMRRVSRPRHRQQSPAPWTDEQIAAYITALADHRHQLPLLLGISLGLRRGEICGLRWTDIDFQQSTIHICNQRQRLADGQIADGSPKSAASDRVIPIPRSVMPVLRSNRQLAGYICSLTPSGLDAAHRALVRRLGLPHIPLHGLRHCELPA